MNVIILTTEELQVITDNAATRAVEKFFDAQPSHKQSISFVDTEEYGKETGRHPITIRRWIHRVILKAIKLAGV